MSEACPFCDSVQINDAGFLCGTKVGVDEVDGETVYTRGSHCLQNQLAQKERELEQAKQDRRDALSVKTTEGMTASEWIIRTGIAERELEQANKRADEAYAKLALVKAHWGKAVDDDQHGCGLSKSYMEEFDAILADRPEVLAVAEADDVFIDDYGEKYIRVFVGADFFGVPGTVIVLRRNGDNGSGE